MSAVQAATARTRARRRTSVRMTRWTPGKLSLSPS